MPGYVFGDLIGTRGQQKSPPTSQAHVSELAGPAPGVRTVYTPAFFAPEAMVGRYMRRKVAIRAMRTSMGQYATGRAQVWEADLAVMVLL